MTQHVFEGSSKWSDTLTSHGSDSNNSSIVRPTASTSSAPIQDTGDTARQAPEASSTTSSTSISYSHRRTSAAVRNSFIPRANPSFASASHSPWVPAAAVQPHLQYISNTHPATHRTHECSSLAWKWQRSPTCLSVLPTVLEHSSPGCLPTFRASNRPQTPAHTALRLPYAMKMACGPALTIRALAAGLGVGAVLCFSNMYFGLQTGWVTMGSLQSAILGYGLFQGLGAAKLLTHRLTVAENVIVQTTAVATATMPLAAGLVGIIPALGLLTVEDSPKGPVTFTPWQLMGWCASLAFFGVFVAVPLRYQTIIREKLRFPSGTATASVIRTLHGIPNNSSSSSSNNYNSTNTNTVDHTAAIREGSADGDVLQQQQQQQQRHDGSSSSNGGLVDLEVAVAADQQGPHSEPFSKQMQQQQQHQQHSMQSRPNSTSQYGNDRSLEQQRQWARALHVLLWVFAVSGAYSIAAAWIKALRVLPVFDWLGLPAATAWGWVLQPSAGYIGQGMIMGPKTAWSMMAGAITGWAVLGPNVRARGWAPGPITDIETGAAGWLMWLGLALLLGDCFSELGLLLLQTLIQKARANGWLGRIFGRSSTGAQGSGVCRGLEGSNGSNREGCRYQQLGLVDDSVEQGLVESGLNRNASRSGSVVELSPSSSVGALQGSLESQSKPTNSKVDEQSNPQQSFAEQQQQPWESATPAADDDNSDYQFNEFSSSTDSGSRTDESSWLLSAKFWVPGLVASTVLATAILAPLMGMPFYEPLVAVVVALLVALLAVRALGQTDLNPVSGVGKISQLVFAVVSPGSVIPNLVAGAIAEAGAQQAGDLMQDFKTAHLLGVPPSAQLVAMLLGSAVSVPLSVGAYLLYTSAWEVPGPTLPAPTAQIWLDMAKLVNGGKLPDHVGPFCAVAAAIAAALPVLQHLLQRLQKRQQRGQAQQTQSNHSSAVGGDIYSAGRKYSEEIGPMGSHSGGPVSGTHSGSRHSLLARFRLLMLQAASRLWTSWRGRTLVDWVLALLPSGVGFAVGMYLTPNWTVPRLLGSVVDQVWLLLNPASHAAFMMVTASGLVLGEGCASIVTAVVHAATSRA